MQCFKRNKSSKSKVSSYLIFSSYLKLTFFPKKKNKIQKNELSEIEREKMIENAKIDYKNFMSDVRAKELAISNQFLSC